MPGDRNVGPLQDGPSEVEIRIFATRLLGAREYAVEELIARIRRKWPGVLEAENVVGQMVTENLVSDERYAEAFVRSRQNRLQGPIKIRATLGSRGVNEATIAVALDHSQTCWIDLAVQWLERQSCVISSIRDRARYYRRLLNRGFSHSQSMAALDQVAARTVGHGV